jgi:ribosomal protein S18 acetylase RimI-like enzyme
MQLVALQIGATLGLAGCVDVTIRSRADADLPACVDALRAVYEASGYPTRWPSDPAEWLTPDGLLASWVALHDGAVVGQVGVLAGSAEPGLAGVTGVPVDDLALVTRLYVSPAARGLGLARQLVQTVTEHGERVGLRIGLDVMEESRAAIALYDSLGWRHVASGQAGWKTQAGIRPMVRYYLSPEPG